MLDDKDVHRVLVITAHPDDVDFGAAGTIAQWTKAGIDVHYCVVTDGDAGGVDLLADRSEIPRIRQAEQRAAAAELGVSDVRFLGYPDGGVTASQELRRDLSRAIRQVRPQRLLCQSAERNYRRLPASHPDHLAVGEAAICAVYPDARNPFAHPTLLQEEGLEAWIVPEVWIMAAPESDHFHDITDTFQHKLAALRAHASQTGHMTDLEERLRQWAEGNAALGGLDEDRLAEAFLVVSLS